MRLLIAGSRSITDYAVVEKAVNLAIMQWAGCGVTVDEEVSGCTSGVDRLGEHWARSHGVPRKLFPADWKKHGKAAGFIRNAEMAEHATHAVVVWDGVSRGTANMIAQMQQRGKPVYVHKT